MFFTPPFPFAFVPAPITTGAPMVMPIGSNPIFGRYLLTHFSSPGAPSSSRQLASWGMWAGVPRDALDQPYIGRSVLQINATFDFMGSFTTRGLFASPFNAAWVKIFVEELDAGFNFRRAFAGPPQDILRVSPAYFSGADSFPRAGRSSAFLSIVAEPRFRYRVFVDVEAEIRADGFGGIGGSSATASFGVNVESVGAAFHYDPAVL